MRIVQYESGGVTGCGVSVGDDVFATGYADTIALESLMKSQTTSSGNT